MTLSIVVLIARAMSSRAVDVWFSAPRAEEDLSLIRPVALSLCFQIREIPIFGFHG